MSKQFGYWVDVQNVQLSEKDGKTSSEIQGAPFGEYEHPFYGKIKFDEVKLNSFAASVNNRVRDVDPDIDFDHKMFRADAAGWVKSARVDPQNGLMLHIEWTPEGVKGIKDRSYRYFSPEFADEWQHPRTGVVFKDVLNGGGLTNRPFLKDIAPVNLSEMFAELSEGESMDPKALRAALGLAENATDDEVKAKLKAGGFLAEAPAPTPPTPPPATPPPATPPTPPVTPPVPPTPAPNAGPGAEPGTQQQLTEVVPDDLKELFEANPHIKTLYENYAAANKQLHLQEAALRLAEVERSLASYNLAQGRRIRLTPAFLNEAKDTLLACPDKKLQEKVYGLLNMVVSGKSVFFELGEHGQMRSDSLGGDPTVDYPKAIQRKLQEAPADKQLSYEQAAKIVAQEDPDLFRNYQAAMRG